jgi:PilZ domain-containing protein
MPLDERRRHRRVRLFGQAGGRATVFADFRLAALSESGAELEMAVPLAVGARCDLTLNLADGTLDVKGRVADVQQGAGNGHYMVGVDFVALDALDHALLRSFLERERAKEG